jgi:hypothetical protein
MHPCQVKQANLEYIDTLLITALKDISINPSAISKYTQTVVTPIDALESHRKQLSSIEVKIRNLVSSLQDSQESTAAKYIIATIEDLDKRAKEARRNIIEIESAKQICEKKRDHENWLSEYIQKEMATFDSLPFENKLNFIRSVVSTCVWKGDSLVIVFV